jgi:hypothetical protein
MRQRLPRPYARAVQVVELPGLPEKGDVYDYLETHHSKSCFRKYRKHHCGNQPPKNVLVDASQQFLTTMSSDVEWLVDGVIQRGANGFICSAPKVGKSRLAAAILLALGNPWIGFDVPRPVKTSLIAREDHPAKWRVQHLLRRKGRTMADLEGCLYLNTREQTPEFRLDKPDLTSQLIEKDDTGSRVAQHGSVLLFSLEILPTSEHG